MASKKPAKITLCKCQYPRVYEVAEFKPSFYDEALAAIPFYNSRLHATTTDPENNFYFLNTRIAGQTKIISNIDNHDYPGNDPEVIDKLQAYLEGQAPLQQGSAQKRGKNDKYIDP